MSNSRLSRLETEVDKTDNSAQLLTPNEYENLILMIIASIQAMKFNSLKADLNISQHNYLRSK